jgi:hypothetical protein
MLAALELLDLGLVTLSAGVGGGDFDLGNVIGRGMAGAVAVGAGDPDLAMAAQAPVGDNVRLNLLMALDALVRGRRGGL